MNRIAAVVILFNPDQEIGSRIAAVASQVEQMILIDNAVLAHDIRTLCGEYANVQYVSLGGNQGVGAALNRAVHWGVSLGFDWLLTLDDDIKVPTHFVSNLLEEFQKSNRSEPVGIIAPAYNTLITSEEPFHENLLFTMMCGNLINLHACKKAGGFREDLFIDHVDHEYCLRLISNGFSVVRMNRVNLIHRPGKVNQKTAFLSFRSHRPERIYYFFRNGLLVAYLYRKQFPAFTSYFLKRMIIETLKIIFQDEKAKRIKMIWIGIKDFRQRRLGPLLKM